MALALLLVVNVLIRDRSEQSACDATTALIEAHDVIVTLHRVLISSVDAETPFAGLSSRVWTRTSSLTCGTAGTRWRTVAAGPGVRDAE